MRPMLAALLVALVLGACTSSDPASDTPPELTEDVEAELVANAIDRACATCDRLNSYVLDRRVDSGSLPAQEPLPTSIRSSIESLLPGVVFVDEDDVDELMGDDGFVDGGAGVLVMVGEVEWLASDVTGIEVGVVFARDGAKGAIYQFRWNGSEWLAADSDDTGVTVTSWVS